jgi:hypothetical protein
MFLFISSSNTLFGAVALGFGEGGGVRRLMDGCNSIGVRFYSERAGLGGGGLRRAQLPRGHRAVVALCFSHDGSKLVSSTRLIDESPWLQFTSECQRC